MPPEFSRTSYTGKPVRKLKLPKIGPTKTKNFFDEYVYALLAVVFLALSILGKAGGFSTYNAVVISAWVTAILWCGHQLKNYFAEKSKTENGKTPEPQTPAQTEAPKRPLPLPIGMKPMIGPQWPVKSGARPSWPKLPKERPAATAPPQSIQQPGVTPLETSPPNSSEKKRAFVYERPTLPGRAPKLPHNWANLNEKKQNGKKRDSKKPKR